MKALIVSLGLMLIITTGFAQLVQENVSDSKFKTLQLDNGQTKYLQYQKKGNILNVLNLDHSVWKTVEIPLPKGHFLDEVKSISTNTFNEDHLVEILYTSTVYDYKYSFENSTNGEDFISTSLNIINEKGEVLLTEEKIKDYAIIESYENKKLFVYKNIGSGIHKKTQSVVYAISK